MVVILPGPILIVTANIVSCNSGSDSTWPDTDCNGKHCFLQTVVVIRHRVTGRSLSRLLYVRLAVAQGRAEAFATAGLAGALSLLSICGWP